MRLRYMAVLAAATLLVGCNTGATTAAGSSTAPSTAPATSSSTTPGATTAAAPAAMTAAVTIQGFAFNPASTTIRVGGTVTWTNMDSSTHTATPDNTGDFTSTGDIATGKTGSATFTKAGTFTYKCIYHSNMHGTIIVVN